MASDPIDAEDEAKSWYRTTEVLGEDIRFNNKFDADHLAQLHGYIFQDVSDQNRENYRPGAFRDELQEGQHYTKQRALVGTKPVIRYEVHYDSGQGMHDKLNAALSNVSVDDLRQSTDAEFSKKMNDLYASLDHIHPFAEGNSRTLRTFTQQLSQEAGKELDWHLTGRDNAARNELYMARDLAVLEKTFPGLDEQRAMTTNNLIEYESYPTLDFLRQQKPLQQIIASISKPQEQIQDQENRSLAAIQDAGKQHNLIVRDAADLGKAAANLDGPKIAETDHHVLVQVSPVMAVHLNKGDLGKLYAENEQGRIQSIKPATEVEQVNDHERGFER